MNLKQQKHATPRYTFLIAAFGAIGFMFSCSPKTGVAGAKTITAEHLAQGKTIFDNSCGKCHDLPSPADHNAQDWVGIMNSMAPKAKLNAEQHQMVYDYIVSVK
jgi:cytochrome c5